VKAVTIGLLREAFLRECAKRLSIVSVGTAILLSTLSASALSQTDTVENLLERIQTSTATREALAAIETPPPNTTDKHETAIFHHKRGRAHFNLGNYDQAIKDLQIALQNNMPNRISTAGWGDRWRIQNDLGSALSNKGDRVSERAYWEGIASQYPNNSPEHHYALLRIARAQVNLGNFIAGEQALKNADESLEHMRNRRDWGWLRYNQLYLNQSRHAALKESQGNVRDAERLRRLALENAKEDFELQLSVNRWLRVAGSNLGYARGLLARLLAYQGKLGEAEYLAQATVEDAIKYFGPNSLETALVLRLLAYIRHQSGNLGGAEMLYRHAVEVVLKSGVARDSSALGAAREALGHLLVQQGRWSEALTVFEERAEDLRTMASESTQPDEISWALALHLSGKSQLAKEMAERLLAKQNQHPVTNPYNAARYQGVLGMALTRMGDLPSALMAFQAALRELARSDSEIVQAEQASFSRIFWRTEILEAYLELLAKLQSVGKVPPGLDVVAESFRIADLARGSSVQAAISASAMRAQLPNAELAGMVRRLQDTQNHSIALDKILSRLMATPDSERLNSIIASMQADVVRLRKERADLQTEIQQRFPEYSELIAPRPATLQAVKQSLSDGEAMVSIYLGKNQSYVWTLGSKGRTVFRTIPIGRAEIEADVAKLRATLMFDTEGTRLPEFDLETAAKLFQALLAPDAALWQKTRVLSVIPHAAIGQVPFALLPTSTRTKSGADDDYSSTPWLIREVAVAQVPSAAAFLALRRNLSARVSREAFIGFGDPLFVAADGNIRKIAQIRNLSISKEKDAIAEQLAAQPQKTRTATPKTDANSVLSGAFQLIPSLPDTGQELLEIAAVLKADPKRDVYLGSRASESQVKQARLDDRRVVAFATHGVAPGEVTGLDQPALVLSNPVLTGENAADGFLTMDEILSLKLDADWVVLSACNTASSDGKTSEAVSGLGRAFFFAGARSLLVSSWAVETTSARKITTTLFRREAENPSLTRAEALRQAMLEVMESGDANAGLRYAHPVFWAPFSLVGDGLRN
jgi:CHAT domain-containing protein